ncbi:WxL domain-containing protein [Enterococcus casseliflavus]|uniref:WxL domain-containing protein n=1 Tax=Enterococcus casseliflavus TaxID=37734 RepID=UPI001883876A|nr:WxL domain-containing protein [Enterococcus casseliflavus]MBE9909344.1 hypothetical protein [Enterococcus casseliflavus]
MKKKVSYLLLLVQLLSCVMPLNHLGTIVHAQESEYSESETSDSHQEMDGEPQLSLEESTDIDEETDETETIPKTNIDENKLENSLTSNSTEISIESMTVEDWSINQWIAGINIRSSSFENEIIVVFIGVGNQPAIEGIEESMVASGGLTWQREVLSREALMDYLEIEELPGEYYELYDVYGGFVTSGELDITLDYKISENFDYKKYIAGEYISLPDREIMVTSTSKNTAGEDRIKLSRVKGPKFKMGSITERFENSNGATILPTESIQGMPGMTHLITPKTIDGYTFQRVSAIVNGQLVSDFEQLPFSTSAQEITYTYSKINDLAVEVRPQELLLGTSEAQLDLSQMIDKVLFNGNQLDPTDYTVELAEPYTTPIVTGTSNLQLIITYQTFSTEVTVPCTIVWGNTINVSGSWWNSNGFRSVGAFTLHPEEGISYVPGQGASSLELAALGQVGNSIFSTFSLYKEGDSFNLDKITPYFKFEMNGSETPNNLYEQFIGQNGGKNLVNAQVGDVVESWHIFKNNQENEDSLLTNREWNILRQSTNTADYTNGNNSVYYEVTSNQFKPLKINQVVVNNDNKIVLNETDENLVNRISEFVDLPEGVSFVGFTQYPDRVTLGEAVGKIVLEEQLSTGKMIQKEYEITFTVEPGNISISQISDFDFGEITKPSRDIRTYAKGNEVPRMIIQDYSALTGWSLNVSATSFSNKKGETIPGATISLKDIKPVSTSHKWMHIPEELELNEAGRSLAVMTNPQHVNGLEQGETVIEMGDEKNGELTGVELTIPAHSSIDSDDYSATITWELVTDPTM